MSTARHLNTSCPDSKYSFWKWKGEGENKIMVTRVEDTTTKPAPKPTKPGPTKPGPTKPGPTKPGTRILPKGESVFSPPTFLETDKTNKVDFKVV